MGHLHHTADLTLWQDSVPLSLRRSEQGFKLHQTANLSSFADNLKTNSSSEIFFILIAQQNIAVLPPVEQMRGVVPDSTSEIAADLTYSTSWSQLDCCMLDCSSAGKSDDPVSLKNIKAQSATEYTYPAEYTAV